MRVHDLIADGQSRRRDRVEIRLEMLLKLCRRRALKREPVSPAQLSADGVGEVFLKVRVQHLLELRVERIDLARVVLDAVEDSAAGAQLPARRVQLGRGAHALGPPP